MQVCVALSGILLPSCSFLCGLDTSPSHEIDSAHVVGWGCSIQGSLCIQLSQELIRVLAIHLGHRARQLQEVVWVVELASQLIEEVLGPGSLKLLLGECAQVIELDQRRVSLHVLALLYLLLDLLLVQDILDLGHSLVLLLLQRLVVYFGLAHHELCSEEILCLASPLIGLRGSEWGHGRHACDRVGSM